MSDLKLKSCFVCKSEVALEEKMFSKIFPSKEKRFTIYCSSCTLYFGSFKNKEKLISNWNNLIK